MKPKNKTRIMVEKALVRLRAEGRMKSPVNYHLIRAEAGRNQKRNPSFDNVLWELNQLHKEGKVTKSYNPKNWGADRFKFKLKKGVRM